MPKVVEANVTDRTWMSMSLQSLAKIFVSGLVVGLAMYALYLVLERFVFGPILCKEVAGFATCDSKESFAGGAAIIVGSLAALVLLVRERVYRPLLVVLAVGLSLWGIFALIVTLPWVLAGIASAIIFGLAYALFAWLAQPINFIVAGLLVAVAVVVIRLVLSF